VWFLGKPEWTQPARNTPTSSPRSDLEAYSLRQENHAPLRKPSRHKDLPAIIFKLIPHGVFLLEYFAQLL
jgi:hypothetical protein